MQNLFSMEMHHHDFGSMQPTTHFEDQRVEPNSEDLVPSVQGTFVCSVDDQGQALYYDGSGMMYTRLHESDIDQQIVGHVTLSNNYDLEEYLSMPQYQAHELPVSPESPDLCYDSTNQQLDHNIGAEYSYCSEGALASNASEYVDHEPERANPSQLGDALSGDYSIEEKIRAAILAHPQYPRLVAAHMNCQKVAASPEAVSQIDDLIREFKERQSPPSSSIGANPELDHFMASYCEMLVNCEQEVSKTYKDAMSFCKKLEQQLSILSNGNLASGESDDRNDGFATSDEDESGCEDLDIDPLAEEKDIKEQLMRRYSGRIGSLKQEFMKKKKKGKLPVESRQQLLDWWSTHLKWPYPSEEEKVILAESTGLGQKQINNWFINQRKRHWRPAEEHSMLTIHPS